MRKFFLLILFFILLSSFALAETDSCLIENDTCTVDVPTNNSDSHIVMNHSEDSLCIIYFYGDGCSVCAKTAPFIEELEEKYDDKIHFTKLEIYNNLKNYQTYNDFCSVQNIKLTERGIPLVAVGDEVYMGYSQIKNNLEPKINELLKEEALICPLGTDHVGVCGTLDVNESEIDPAIPGLKKELTWPLVIITGLVDGINPCAFAVLIFLITFLISVSSNKKRMIKAGSAYIFAVYISYLLAGLGLISILQFIGFANIIVKIAAVIAIIAGLINVKDFFWYGKGFSLEIPKSKKPLIERWTSRANVPGAIILGLIVSMVELPCTGGVYLAILALLASTATKLQAVGYLLVYNLMFVLPLIIILLAVIFGMKAEHIENFRQSKKGWMKLLMGLVLLALGVFMLLF